MPSRSSGGGRSERNGGKAGRHLPAKRKATKLELLDYLDFLLDRLYRLLYYTGAQIVRKERRLGRRLELWFDRRRDKNRIRMRRLGEWFRRKGRELKRELTQPVHNLRGRLSDYRERVHQAKAEGRQEELRELLHVAGEVAVALLHVLGSILNYVAPVAAALFLIFMVNYFTSLEFALEVNYNGETLGYIKDESVYENAEEEVKNRIVYEDASSGAASESGTEGVVKASTLAAAVTSEGEALVQKNAGITIPQYKLAVVSEDKLMDSDTLTDRIIQASGSEIMQASGIYIESASSSELVFKGATTEPEKVLDLLSEMLDAYETDTPGETIQFVNRVKVRDGLYPVQSLKTVPAFRSMLTGNVSGESYYTVVEGDNPSIIADKTGVPLVQLQSMNPDLTDNFLPGKQILVSRSVPMMKIQATRREVYEEELDYDVEEVQSTKYISGYREITTNGVPGIKEVEANITYIDGVEVGRTILKETVVREPKNAIRTIGIGSPQGVGSGATNSGFIWPVKGGYISCPIWGYWGHTGTDIAANSGTTIVASASGVVVRATQTSYGYGKHIIIDHGNGITTLYGHNSALLVTVGQYVTQGEPIALVGRTGNATGNHCHFEIRQGGSYLDARAYIGYTSPY